MKNDKKLERSLALIITCTRRVNRPKDIVTLAKHISYAEKNMEGLKAVAQAVGLSVQQLKDFLAVKKLHFEVKKLVSKRVIDSVDVVKTISKLPDAKQKFLAQSFVKGQINSKDVRVITTFAKKFRDKPIKKVIEDYRKSKDVRLYVVQIRLPKRFTNQRGLRRHFEEIVGKSEIKELWFQEGIAVLEITDKGHKKLREAVRRGRTTLRKFVTAIVDEISHKK